MARLIVLFHDTAPVAGRMAQLGEPGARVVDSMEHAGLYLIEVPDGTEDEWIKRYTRLEGVRIAQREQMLHLA